MAQAVYRIGPFELLHLIRGLEQRSFEGALHLTASASAKHTSIFFRGGVASLCRTDDIVYGFPAHLLRHRLVPPDTFRDLLKFAEQNGRRLEDVLVERSVFSEERLAEIRSALSNEVLTHVMSASMLSYEVQWKELRGAPDGVATLDPWAAFCRAVSGGANADFQRDFISARSACSLSATPRIRELLPVYREHFGESADELLLQVGMAASVRSAAEVIEARGNATAALFALLFAEGLVCDGEAAGVPVFDGLDRPAPPDLAAVAAPQAGLRQPTVQPGLRQPTAQPGLRQPTAQPGLRQPTAQPGLRQPTAQPGLRQPTVQPGLRQATEPSPPPVLEPPDPPAPDSPAPDPPREAPVTIQAQAGAADGPGLDLAAEPPAPPRYGRGSSQDEWAVAFPMGGGEEPPAPELPETGDASVENALEHTYERMKHSNAYTSLDVPQDAPFSQIREAHARIRRKYDVEQYRQFVLGRRGHGFLDGIRKLADRSYRTLLDPKQRVAHDKMLGIGDGTLSDTLRAAFEAEASYAAGRRHLQGKDWSSAEMAFRAAIEKNPADPAYHAFYGWALCSARGGAEADAASLEQALRQAEHAVELGPRLAAAHMLRGRIARIARKDELALESFQKVLTITPDNEEARREVTALKKVVKGGGKSKKSRFSFFKR